MQFCKHYLDAGILIKILIYEKETWKCRVDLFLTSNSLDFISHVFLTCYFD